MRVNHAMVLNVLDQWEGQQAALHTLLLDNHETPERREALVERAVQVLASLLRAKVVEPDDGSSVDDWLPADLPDAVRPRPRSVTRTLAGTTTAATRRQPAGIRGPRPDRRAARRRRATAPPRTPSSPPRTATRPPAVEEHRVVGTLEHFVRGDEHRVAEGPFQVALDLGDGFALNQPLSAFALAVLEMLDPEAPGYALDVVSVIEATLDDPRPVLMAQRFEARGEAVGAMKADGMEYEDRMDALDDVTWPRPLAEELEAALRVYRQTPPVGRPARRCHRSRWCARCTSGR